MCYSSAHVQDGCVFSCIPVAARLRSEADGIRRLQAERQSGGDHVPGRAQARFDDEPLPEAEPAGGEGRSWDGGRSSQKKAPSRLNGFGNGSSTFSAVRRRGLEPPRVISPLEPEAGATPCAPGKPAAELETAPAPRDLSSQGCAPVSGTVPETRSPYRQASPHPALEAPPLGPVRWAISDRSSGRYLTEARAQTAHQAWARAVRLGDVVLPFAECSFRVLEEQRA